MSNLMEFYEVGWIPRLGWALVHFLWQGTAVVVFYAIVRQALSRQSAQVRYACGCLTLVFLVLLPVVTFLRAEPTRVVKNPPRIADASRIDGSPTVSAVTSPQVTAADPRLASAVSSRSGTPWRATIESRLAWVVMIWFAGTILLTARLLTGWFQLRRMLRAAHGLTEAKWCQPLEEFQRRLRISRPVRLMETAWIEVPTVIGWLWPVILLPASALTGLSPAQWEAILAHELAHIRRWDYLVNLLQNAVEIILFYHPGVWWISRVVREEREHCCDALVIEVCGDRMTYARALLAMAELRLLPQGFAMAATSGPLLRRIRHILNQDTAPELRSGPWLIGGLMLLLWTALLAGVPSGSRAGSDPATPPVSTTADPWHATLKTGVEVELVSVACRYATNARAFWTPSGSWKQGLYNEGNFNAFKYLEPSELDREFTVRLSHLPTNGCDVKWDIQPIISSAGWGSHSRPIQRDWELWTAHTKISDATKTCTVRVGIASGPWEDQLRVGANGVASSASLSFAASPVVETAGQTMVVITVNGAADDYRLAAVDTDEHVIRPARAEPMVGVGQNVQQHTLYFDEPPSRMQRFLFQTRPYEWLEFKEVQANPSWYGPRRWRSWRSEFIWAPKASDGAPVKLQFRWVAKDGEEASVDLVEDQPGIPKLRVLRQVAMDESMVQSAAVGTNYITGEAELRVTFSDEGTARLASLSGANIGRQLASFWDGRLLCAPVIAGQIVSGPGPANIPIPGAFSLETAQAMARALNRTIAGQLRLHSTRLQFRWVAREDENAISNEYDFPNNPGGKLRLLKDVVLDESAIASATVVTNLVSQHADVELVFTAEGKDKFSAITGANIDRQLAILWDNRVLCAPRIASRIPGGRGVITGDFTADEAKAIVQALNQAAARKPH